MSLSQSQMLVDAACCLGLDRDPSSRSSGLLQCADTLSSTPLIPSPRTLPLDNIIFRRNSPSADYVSATFSCRPSRSSSIDDHSKKAADNRFKNRGKRPAAASADETAIKKKKDEEPLTAYQKEVAALAARDLKDEGGGRPIMK